MREKTQKIAVTVPVILAMLSLMIIPLPLATSSQNRTFVPEYAMLQGGYSNLASETFTGTFNVTTIVGPDNSWKALETLLESVQTSIYVEIYGINDRDILDALWDIKTSKPSVDMKVLLGNHSLGYASPNDYVAYNLTQDLVIPVRWTNDQWRFTHAKFIIIDNESVIIQSGNWAKTSFPNRSADELGNREWNIAIHNPTVTAYYLDVFDLDWNQGIDYKIADGMGTAITNESSYFSGVAVHPFTTIGHYNEYMEITPVFSNDTSLSSILDLINSANSTLDIQIPYYTNFNESSVIDQIIDATIDAADRGVEVRVITEEANKDNDEVAALFAEHGIFVVWFKETWFSALHNKGMIVDGVVVYISSINFSEASVSENREAGVIIRNSNVTSYYLAVFDYDWNRGEPATGILLTQRPITVTASDSVQVNASFIDFLGIQEAILSYRVNSGLWSNVTMSNITESELQVWNGVIPAQVDGSIVEYKVYVRDSADDWFTSLTRSYTVGTGGGPQEGPDLFLILVGIGVVIASVVAVVIFKVKPTGGSKRKGKKK